VQCEEDTAGTVPCVLPSAEWASYQREQNRGGVRPARRLASASGLDEDEDDAKSDDGASADGDEKHQWGVAETLYQLEDTAVAE